VKPQAILKVLNPILGILVLCQMLTGVTGSLMPRDTFEILHEGGAILLALAAALHVTLNWNWIKANYLKKQAP
jgi:hypothetical protein